METQKLYKDNSVSIIAKTPIPDVLKWHVFYTYPKSEKKVADQLTQAGYETFLPCKLTIRQWHDRKKSFLVPLFPSYLFVKTSKNKLYYILKYNNICSFVKFNDKPAIIREEEIINIKKILGWADEIDVTNELQCGDKVKITNGLLSGLEGYIVRKNGSSKFAVQIKELMQYITVVIDAKHMLNAHFDYI